MDIEFNKIYKANSDLLLKEMIDKRLKFDLILTDPPYNLKKDFGNDSDKLSLDNFLEVTKQRLMLCSQLLDENASIIWFGTHHYIGFIQSIMYEIGLKYRRMNIWYYENGFSRTKKAPLTQYEPFLWFSKTDNWIYNVDDVRIPYKSKERLKNPIYYKAANGVKKEWRPNPLGAMRGDIWSFPTLAGKIFQDEKTEHPTQKPEALITEIIKAYCPKDKNGKYNGTILDPFHGSGTLGVCCKKLNKLGHNINWIGIELEQKWVDIAMLRLEQI